MTEYEIPILTSSNALDGAQQISSNIRDAGSIFYITLQRPIEVPRNAINCTIEVQKATVWFVTPNILSTLNNQFYLIHLGTPYQASIPQGLYDINGLQSAMEREITAVGAPPNLFNLLPDGPTSKVNIRINQAGTQIDLDHTDTFEVILGFDQQLVPAAPSVGVFNQLGDTEAQFNTFNSYLVHCDITEGFRTNGNFANNIDEILIDVVPGQQIVQKNVLATRIPAPTLIGSKLKTIKMWITTESNEPINMNGEFWTTLMVIRYRIPS